MYVYGYINVTAVENLRSAINARPKTVVAASSHSDLRAVTEEISAEKLGDMEVELSLGADLFCVPGSQ